MLRRLTGRRTDGRSRDLCNIENLKIAMKEVSQHTLKYWEDNRSVTEYVIMLYCLSKWELPVPPHARVSEVANCLRPLCPEVTQEHLWTDASYNELELIELLRRLIGYIGSRCEQTDTITISLPRILTEDDVFDDLISNSGKGEQFKLITEWAKGMTNDKSEVLIPFVILIRMTLYKLSANGEVMWTSISKQLRNTLLGSRKLKIDGDTACTSSAEG